MMLLDTLTYLPGDILTKVDRASMSVGLESRAPYLDHRLIEWAWNLPFNMKYNSTTPKWILREILKKYIPKELINRPKMGFGVPIDKWLRGPLKEWASDLLSEDKIRNQNIFNEKVVTEKLDCHIKGKKGLHHELWTLLMFQSWIETN